MYIRYIFFLWFFLSFNFRFLLVVLGPHINHDWWFWLMIQQINLKFNGMHYKQICNLFGFMKILLKHLL